MRITEANKFVYLRGDLHSHCERLDLLGEHLSWGDRGVDFVALTNHSHKLHFIDQVEMVARARDMVGIPVFYGFEWNAPKGRHANVIFPPCDVEAELAAEFIARFDPRVTGGDVEIGASIEWLAEVGEDCRPLVFFNHPYPGHWSDDVMNEYREADPTDGRIVVGMEAVHGHQGWEAYDLYEFDGCRVGGLSDGQYVRGRRFAMLAGSDFHVQKQSIRYDYPIGVFNNSCVGVHGEGEHDGRAILDGIRNGRAWAMMGGWLEPVRFEVGGKGMGEKWSSVDGDGELVIEFEISESVREVDVIGKLWDGDEVGVLRSFGEFDAGVVKVSMMVLGGSNGFVRLRVVAGGDERPVSPNGDAPKMCFSSGILIDNEKGKR